MTEMNALMIVKHFIFHRKPKDHILCGMSFPWSYQKVILPILDVFLQFVMKKKISEIEIFWKGVWEKCRRQRKPDGNRLHMWFSINFRCILAFLTISNSFCEFYIFHRFLIEYMILTFEINFYMNFFL